MEKDFCLGLLAGMLGGAILSANSFKIRRAIKDGQEQIMTTLNKISECHAQKNDEQEEG